MNNLQIEKIKKFMDDQVMSQAVFDSLLGSFLGKKSQDVQFLAASRIAVDFLNDAWADLKRLQDKEVSEQIVVRQVGL